MVDLTRHFNSRPAIDRFNAKWALNESNGCWEWTAMRDRDGYGSMWGGKELGKEDNLRAHRVSWMLHRGELPDDKLVLHRCDNPRCVNPDHLFIGTGKDNIQDALAKGRLHPNPANGCLAAAARQRAKTHCPKGHAYSGENLRVYSGNRYCRECGNDAARRYNHRKREAQLQAC